jgi:deazaflavin-dependent oxidoreductase (nitroreductase family)
VAVSSPTVKFEQRCHGWTTYPSRYGFLWFFYKAPLIHYRLGLGPLLRRLFRMLVLTTRGRKSGHPRHTMLEHAWHNGHAYIAPGWGEKTLWYQNILADPQVTVQRGRPSYGAVAVRVIDNEELAGLYHATAGKSPVWKEYLDSWGIEDTLEDYVANKDRLVVLRLDPINYVPLPPLRADLIWVWPLIVACLVAWALLG